jgi:hypothetical protein
MKKIGIVIPLKAKAVSKDWKQVQNSLERTLRSVINQTSKSYKVCVVGHDRPNCLKENGQFFESVTYYQFDAFPPPCIIDGDDEHNQLKYERDRCYKIFTGISKLNFENKEIIHWYPLDADDLLHKNLVETVLTKSNFEAFIIKNGYVFYEAMNVLNRTKSFNIFCGSSAILSSSLLSLPVEINEDNYTKFLFTKVGHVNMEQYLIENKVKFNVPKDSLAIYMRDNGENISRSGKWGMFYAVKRNLKAIVRFHFFSGKLKDSFALK